MSRSTVLKYETGRQIPPVDRICDIADIFDVSTDYLYGVSDCSLPLSKLNEIFYDDMTYSELISIVLGLSEEHQKAFMIINIGVPQKKTKSHIRVKCFIHRLTNRSQRLQSLSVVQLPELSPMPSKTAHKSLIGLLSVSFRVNKKGLDSSVFTFRENH